jgi:hypothetical protein
MYPEERLGFHLNSASMMWEMVEFVFEGVRRVMRDNGRARSGCLTMVWSVVLQQFWEVSLKLHVVSWSCSECLPQLFLPEQNITHADTVKITATSNANTRCDALFKKETTNIDVQRTITTYTTRYYYTFFLYVLCRTLQVSPYLIYFLIREALKSLQGAGGAYCLVTAGKEHVVRGGSLRGFTEGDNIRVIRPKDNTKRLNAVKTTSTNGEDYVCTLPSTTAVGYGLKFTFDVPVGKAMGVLTVRACWHDIVFRNELGFTESMFLY